MRRLPWKSSKVWLRSEKPEYSKSFKQLRNIEKPENKIRALRNKRVFKN